MIPIEFRAWDPVGRKMYEFAVIKLGRVDFCWNGDDKNLTSFPGYTSEGVDYSVMIPLQFTGLYDKNGKKIFNGDIVEINKKTAEVAWADGGFYFKDKNLDFDQYNWADDAYRMEVIGDIYSNPELVTPPRNQ